MSAGFLTSNAEWLALRAVDHLARDLYLALRRCMDFRTGIVGGPHKAISWQALREDCEVPGRPGVRCFRPTEQQLRRRVEQLEKCGLVRRISVGLSLQIRMLMAKTDSSDQKKAGGGARGEKKPVNASAGAGRRGNRETRSIAKADTHPGPGNPYKPPTPPTPPTPPCGGPVEVSSNQQPCTDAFAGAAEAEPDAQHAHRLSEQRERAPEVVGNGPAGQLADAEKCEAPAWSPLLHWPMRITPDRRPSIAEKLAALPGECWQRVLDEWAGCMAEGGVRKPWRFLGYLADLAARPGWLPEHADLIAAQRQQARAASELLRQQREAPPVVAPRRGDSPAVARMRKLVKPRGER